jgi:hypothetical protein
MTECAEFQLKQSKILKEKEGKGREYMSLFGQQDYGHLTKAFGNFWQLNGSNKTLSDGILGYDQVSYQLAL